MDKNTCFYNLGNERFDYSFEEENSRKWYREIGDVAMYLALIPVMIAMEIKSRVMESRENSQEELERDVGNLLRLLK